jgi:hypothetical protein
MLVLSADEWFLALLAAATAVAGTLALLPNRLGWIAIAIGFVYIIVMACIGILLQTDYFASSPIRSGFAIGVLLGGIIAVFKDNISLRPCCRRPGKNHFGGEP